MELKKALENKKLELMNEFEADKKQAQFFVKGKEKLIKDVKILDTKIESLISKCSLITAKIEAINDMIDSKLY